MKTEILQKDCWLSSILGYPAFRLDASPPEGPTAFKREISGNPKAFCYAKIPTTDITQVKRLTRSGFVVVDVNMTLIAEKRYFAPSSPDLVELSEASVQRVSVEQSEQILEIAGSCFRYSRFHLDPRFEIDLAHRIKREWISNYLKGTRGDDLWTVVVDGQPAGFLAVIKSESQGRRTALIDLIGVGLPYQNRGLGKHLVHFFLGHYKTECDLLQVGTQVANIPSLKLYLKSGFRPQASHYVLHRHVPEF